MKNFRRFLAIAVLLLPLAFIASQGNRNIYIAQSSAGAASGAGCADARAVSSLVTGDFSSPVTIHLCGIISGSGSTGATGINIQGDSVTILFELGAVLANPQWGAAILSTGHSNITIDGGGNGIIENTAAGSGGASCIAGSCSVHDPSCSANANVCSLIDINGGSNIEIKNVNLASSYVHFGTGGDGDNVDAVYSEPTTTSNLSVHDNKFAHGHAQVLISYCGLTGTNQIYSNVMVDQVWGVAVGDDNNDCSAANVQVYFNDISGFEAWAGPNLGDNGFHQDGVFFYSTNPNTAITGNSFINANYIHGAMTNPSTAHIYISNSSGLMVTILIVNNLLVAPPNDIGHSGQDMEAMIVLGFGAVAEVDLNTIVSTNPCIDTRNSSSAVAHFRLNICSGISASQPMYNGYLDDNSQSLAGKVDYNDYFFLRNGAEWQIGDAGSNYASLSAWQGGCGCDAHSVLADPKLSPTYTLQAGSAAIALGPAITGFPQFADDKNGTARTGSNFDAGAFVFVGGGTSTRPLAPSSVTTVVN